MEQGDDLTQIDRTTPADLSCESGLGDRQFGISDVTAAISVGFTRRSQEQLQVGDIGNGTSVWLEASYLTLDLFAGYGAEPRSTIDIDLRTTFVAPGSQEHRHVGWWLEPEQTLLEHDGIPLLHSRGNPAVLK